MNQRRLRRVLAALVMLLVTAAALSAQDIEAPSIPSFDQSASSDQTALEGLLVKGRAPKTGYSRAQFGDGWGTSAGCDTRNRILQRDLKNIELDSESCKVMSGTLEDPYTGKSINFIRGETTSDDIQIDHVIALSNAWQTGAQALSFNQRVQFANDPLNLLAVDGSANQQKSDGDAATWLPPNKPFRCQYVKRQMDVKRKYALWVTQPEAEAVKRITLGCL